MCLIIIDIQNDYFAGGTMELVGMPEAAANARLLLDAYRAAGLPVLHVQHLAARPDATFFIPGTPGAEINQIVAPIASEPVVVKHFPNSFRETGLLDLLKSKQITNLAICGAMSHMCIDTTVRAAFDLGFTCTLAADACATRNLTFEGRVVPAADVHAAYMAALSLPFARVTTTATIIEELKRL